jgi:UDP-2,3-diacylglucosamine pyrophosphatase LpxH
MKILLSDLHLGCGDALDDFYYSDSRNDAGRRISRRAIRRMHAMFRSFLRVILFRARRRGITPELVLLGDIFDLLQVRGFALCSPRKVDQIYRAHAPFFLALNRFARAGGTITYIIGNHDHEAFHPAVFRALLDYVPSLNRAHGASPLAFYSCDEPGIYAEHGNQLDPLNRYRNYADPMELPVGSEVVLHLVNHYEERYPLIDNIQGTRETFVYAFRHLPGFISKELKEKLAAIPAGSRLALTEIARHLFYALQGTKRLPASTALRDDWIKIFVENEKVLRKNCARFSVGTGLLATFAQLGRHPIRIVREQTDSAFLASALSALRGKRTPLLGSPVKQMRFLILGHSHIPLAHNLTTGKTYFNTGCWRPIALSYRRTEFRVIQRLTYVEIWKAKNGEWKAHLRDFEDESRKLRGTNTMPAAARNNTSSSQSLTCGRLSSSRRHA